MQPVIKTIIFDFGNVVCFFDFGLTFQRLVSHTDLSEEEIRAAIDATDLEDAYESGRITSDEFLRRIRQLCRFTGRCPDDLLKTAWSEIFRPNIDVCRFIPKLKSRYRLLLGSNTNELHALHFRRQFVDTLAHFDHLVFSYEVGARKPKAEFFQHCVQRAECQPAECVFIDDLPANVEGAVACGLRGVVYRNLPDLQRELERLGIRV